MSKVSIKPLADRVIVEVSPAEEKTASGLIIPDTAKEKPQKGTVVAVGNGTKDHTMTVKVGDRVKIYSGNMGAQKKVQLENLDCILVREHEIAMINTKP